MLGLDVAAAAAAAGHDVIALARADLDVSDSEAVAATLALVAPEAIINCAAHTDVDGAETDRDAAAAVNATAPGLLGAAAARCGAWIVHVSTDYVFDGEKTSGPYVESDPTGPRSVYGATKLLGERALAIAAPERHTIVRTSWLFGSGGACFPQTMLRLASERDTLSVVDDQVGCPTFTGHLAPALVELAAAGARRLGGDPGASGVDGGPAGPPSGVLHLAASGECSWYQFATEIFRQAAVSVTVSPCATDQFPRPARRPPYSVLRSERPGTPVLPDWHEGLGEYLVAVGARVAA
jgi:dTDP-4-dehydrorhamnose reductase